MNAKKMWELYTLKCDAAGGYDAWAYGDAPDELAELTLKGIKTATASAYPLYGLEGSELPKAGDYSVVLNSRGEAVCIIKTTRVTVVPFGEVDEDQAYKEGEGDRTLSYWREVHEDFFTKELAGFGMTFNYGMKVVCEEFIRVYP